MYYRFFSSISTCGHREIGIWITAIIKAYFYWGSVLWWVHIDSLPFTITLWGLHSSILFQPRKLGNREVWAVATAWTQTKAAGSHHLQGEALIFSLITNGKICFISLRECINKERLCDCMEKQCLKAWILDLNSFIIMQRVTGPLFFVCCFFACKTEKWGWKISWVPSFKSLYMQSAV